MRLSKFSIKQLISFIVLLIVLFAFSLVQQIQLRKKAFAFSLAERFGLSGHLIWDDTKSPSREYRAELLRQTGAKWVRIPLLWQTVEPQQGKWKWDKYDEIFSLLKKVRIEPLALLVRTPAWASRDGTEGDTPPKDLTEWRNFVKKAVRRYGYQPGGKQLVKHWEIWNEPDINKFGPDDYYQLLKGGYYSVKAIDPDAIVLFGGMSNRVVLGPHFPGCKQPCRVFLPKLLAKPNIGNYFDVFNIHVYGYRHPQNPEFTINKAKRLLANHNLSHKPIWITETNPNKEESEQAVTLPAWFQRIFATGVKKAFLFPAVTRGKYVGLYNRHLIPTKVLPVFQQMTGFSPFNLAGGWWNKITWPDVSGYTAKTALEDIDRDCGAGTAVVMARKRKDWWEEYVKNYGGKGFNLRKNQNYFINISKGCHWTP